LANIGWTIVGNDSKTTIPGQHGYDPTLPDMHGIFIASGYHIKQVVLDEVPNVNVYPLLQKLLSIEGSMQDGNGQLLQILKMEE